MTNDHFGVRRLAAAFRLYGKRLAASPFGVRRLAAAFTRAVTENLPNA